MRFSLNLIRAVILWATLTPACAYAANATVIQALNFGKWYITNNSGDFTISVDTNGVPSHSPELIMVAPPQKGIYTITGLAVSTVVTSIVVTQTQALSSGGGETLTMDSFLTDAPGSTDGSGELPLTLGATAHTSGNGSGYSHGLFTGQLNIEINY